MLKPDRRSFALVIPLLALLLTAASQARTVWFEPYGFAVVVPDKGWQIDTTVSGDGYRHARKILRVFDEEETSTLRIAITFDNYREVSLDDQFARDMVEDMVKEGFEFLDSSYTTLGGVRAMQVSVRVPVDDGGMIPENIVTVIANGCVYQFFLVSKDGQPWNNGELQQIVRSFTFLGQPKLHHPRQSSPPVAPRQIGTPHSTEVLILVICLAMIGVVAFFILNARARERKLQKEFDDSIWKD